MINLLLPNDKKIICNEYTHRVVVMSSLAVSLLFIITIFVVGSFYSTLIINQNSLQELLKTKTNSEDIKEFDNYSTQIKNVNNMINLLVDDQSSLHTVSSLLDRMIVAIPTGIKLGSIDAGPNKSGVWILNLRGTSRQRNDLIAFIDNLKKDPLFEIIDSPFSNLIKKESSEFSMIITLATNVDLQKNVQ